MILVSKNIIPINVAIFQNAFDVQILEFLFALYVFYNIVWFVM